MDPHDPTITDPGFYKVIFENERVRVLEYRDEPGGRTQVHRHPDSVMVTLSAFRRRVSSGERSVEGLAKMPSGPFLYVVDRDHNVHLRFLMAD